MIDYFFKFTDESTAIASAAGTVYYSPSQTVQGVTIPGNWNADRVAPNIKVWRVSQDVGGVHTFLTGWFGIISITQNLPGLMNHAALQIALDRDLASAGQPAILKNNLGAILQDVRFSPVFAGSNYPFGNLI